MKTLKNSLPALLMLAGMGFASTASAALIPRAGGSMVYDTDFNITWLADANLAATNQFGVGGIDSDGRMDYDTAQSWITAMDTSNYLGYNDWRLPTTLQPDRSCSDQAGDISFGFNCSGSELGHLYYSELGATMQNSILSGTPSELAKFSNIQSYVYWSGTEFAPLPGDLFWIFGTDFGGQGITNKPSYLFVWAVRSGDVAAALPEPGITLLLGAGLLGWMGSTTRLRG